MPDKKAEILIAARDLFNRQGYPKTSVDDIAQAVGMQKSSLYYYFKNKEELFLQAFKDQWVEILRGFQKQANKQPTPDQRILACLNASLDHYDDTVLKHKIPIKVIIETRNQFRENMNEINEERVRFYASCIEEGIASGIFKSCEIERLAKTIINLAFSFQYDQFSIFVNQTPSRQDLLKIKEDILYAVGLILDGIKVK